MAPISFSNLWDRFRAAAGAFSAVVVLALYVQSPNVVAHYARVHRYCG